MFGSSASAVPDVLLHGKVNISKEGSGEGRVTSTPDGIDCGDRCSFSFLSNDSPDYEPVTLSGEPEPGSVFDGFGECGDKCTIDPIEPGKSYEVTATFTRAKPSQFPLAVSVAGSGRIMSAPQGIACEPTCSANFAADASVTLQATPTPGWTFGGWGGACSGTGACSFEMTGPRSVTATFAPPDTVYALAVATAGGSVDSDVPGISCGLACVGAFGAGVDVTLTPASVPVAWTGACGGADACVVPMTRPRAVTASLGGAPITQSPIAVGVIGKGTITSVPTGIDCGTTCGAVFARNTPVTLGAAPAPDMIFAGWAGSCRGVAVTCQVALAGATSATASFVPTGTRYPVAVTKAGRGTVTSTPGGIACGSSCSGSFLAGGTTRLDAAPQTGWTFVRWSGACKGKALRCVLGMDGPKSASATFGRVVDPNPPRVTALTSEGARGGVARLRYRARDAAARTTETAQILRGSKLVATVKGKAHEVSPDVLFYFLSWRVPATLAPGDLRFCVTSIDPTGNRSKPSCARLAIT